MSDHGRDLVPDRLRHTIEAAIEASSAAMNQIAADSTYVDGGPPLAVKYMPTKYGALYKNAGPALRISDRDGFTWGTGVYVTPLCFPISNAIYGRAGVVSWFDPSKWRVLDCTNPTAEALYVAWLQQQPMLRDVLITVHSDYMNHLLRNQFREQFGLDCVLFHPDERDSAGLYTAGGDIWMAVGDFDPPGRLKTGASTHFHDARLVVVLEEEFEVDTPALTRSALLALTSTRQANAVVSADIAAKYNATAGWTRVSS